MPRSQPSDRVRRSARSHGRVLAAATDVVVKRGYRGATVEEIASVAGVGKPTIYRWWPNKAALFIEVYEQLVRPDLVVVDTGSVSGDLEALLARLSGLYAEGAAATILSGLIADAQSDPDLAQQLRDTYVAPRRAIIGSVLDRAVQRGEIDPVKDPGFVSDLLSSVVWFRLLLGERRLDQDFIRRLADILVHVARTDTE